MVLYLRVIWVIYFNPVRELPPHYDATQEDATLVGIGAETKTLVWWTGMQICHKLCHLNIASDYNANPDWANVSCRVLPSQCSSFHGGTCGALRSPSSVSPTHPATAGDRQHSCRQLQWKRWDKCEGLSVLTQTLTCSLWITAFGTSVLPWGGESTLLMWYPSWAVPVITHT